jgi:hypothetical protein
LISYYTNIPPKQKPKGICDDSCCGGGDDDDDDDDLNNVMVFVNM